MRHTRPSATPIAIWMANWNKRFNGSSEIPPDAAIAPGVIGMAKARPVKTRTCGGKNGPPKGGVNQTQAPTLAKTKR